MHDINIKNLRTARITHPWDVRVDRHSPLGNPYYLYNETQRSEVCKQYHEYIVKEVNNHNPDIHQELLRLVTIYEKYNKLTLFCWCHPKQCHAETIRTLIILIYNKRRNQ